MSCPDTCDISLLIHLRQTEPQKFRRKTSPCLRALIDGICDENCVLFLLNGTPDIVLTIWNQVVRHIVNKCIETGGTGSRYGFVPLDSRSRHVRGPVEFPPPSGIQINMMPFIMTRSFESSLLPEYLRGYWNAILGREFWIFNSLIDAPLIREAELGKIGYLTIHESFVEAGLSQRRPGLHTDCPGKLIICRNESGDYVCLGHASEEEHKEMCELIDKKLGCGYSEECCVNGVHPWGAVWPGMEGTALNGGIYMASNVADSCAVWNCVIKSDPNGDEVIGNMGDIEHVRDMLPRKPHHMKANTVYWITDRTPHESLPLKKGTFRQYFRLVTSQVSLWFEEHSTKNPLGVVPDPNITKIVKGSKFKENFNLLSIANDDIASRIQVTICSIPKILFVLFFLFLAWTWNS